MRNLVRARRFHHTLRGALFAFAFCAGMTGASALWAVLLGGLAFWSYWRLDRIERGLC